MFPEWVNQSFHFAVVYALSEEHADCGLFIPVRTIF